VRFDFMMLTVLAPRFAMSAEKPSNKTTGLILASVALVFFLGIIVRFWLVR
jgi:hypothetical protein